MSLLEVLIYIGIGAWVINAWLIVKMFQLTDKLPEPVTDADRTVRRNLRVWGIWVGVAGIVGGLTYLYPLNILGSRGTTDTTSIIWGYRLAILEIVAAMIIWLRTSSWIRYLIPFALPHLVATDTDPTS